MKRIVQLLVACFLLVSVQSSFAQTMKVSGIVTDSTGSPLQNSMVMAVRVKDSLLLGFTRSDKQGKFLLTDFQVDTFSLVVAHPKCDDRTYYIFGSKDNYEINIPNVRMTPMSKELQEVVIYANKNPIYYKGDTLVYVADSFKVAEGAVVEDLLKKLPGIKIDSDGKITSQGQEINKVLVDGDEFFGTDPTVATKNLGADGIKTVQIYEKTDNETIGGSEEKIKVLDLKLKEEAKKGYFGRVSGASDMALTPLSSNYLGSTPFYEGELLLNKFNSKQKISLFALGSNTPRSSFGRGDLNKFGLSNEEGANRNFWEPNNTTNTSGIPQTFKAGIYFSDKYGKKQNTDLLFNYSYYNDQLIASTASESQYFLTDTTYYTADSTRNKSNNQSHKLNLTISSQLDSLTLLEFKPSVSFDTGLTDNLSNSNFRGEDGEESLSTTITNKNDSKGLTTNNTIRLYRKFMKKRRELEVRYDLVGTNNQTTGNLYSLSDYKLLGSDTTDQKKTNDNSSLSQYATVSYFEPLSKRLKVNVNYLYEYGKSNQIKETYDKVGNDYTGFRADLSNTFDNIRVQNRAGAELIYETGKHYLSGGAFVRNIQIDNHNLITDSVVNQNINSVLPKFKYEYKPSMSKRLSFTYNTSSAQPTINDLQPVQDNSNPNRRQIGNPDLKPNFVHTMMLNFNTWNALSGKYVWSGASVNLTNNAFGTQTTYDNYGRTYSKTVNVDGNLSAVVYAGAGFPIFNRKIEFQPGFNASFNRTNSYVATALNTTDNFAVTPEMDIDFQWDSLEINVKSSYSYNNPVSSLSALSSTPFTIQKYSIGFDWTLPRGFKISSDGAYTKNAQPGGGFYNTEYFIWNAEIGKKFLKTQNLLLSIKGNDLLNQNINARRVVTGNTVTDNRTTIISRYFLLKVTYRFNNRKTREDDFRGMH
ncbi:MAG: hypothetical protein RI922_1808 [Bacteroidota bacterium]|jgi:hypothetical protein